MYKDIFIYDDWPLLVFVNMKIITCMIRCILCQDGKGNISDEHDLDRNGRFHHFTFNPTDWRTMLPLFSL